MEYVPGAFGMSGLMDSTTRILTQALDGLTARQSVISANLANIDTPNYQPQSVDFETALQSEVAAWAVLGGGFAPSDGRQPTWPWKTTDPRHFSTLSSLGSDASASVSTTNENLRNDQNKVDLETEMTALTETQIKYSADSRLITSKFLSALRRPWRSLAMAGLSANVTLGPGVVPIPGQINVPPGADGMSFSDAFAEARPREWMP